jgi:anti-anti-sigma factor
MSIPTLRSGALHGIIRSVAITDCDRRRVVALHGDFDYDTKDALGRILANAIEATAGDIVVDLAGVDSIDAGTIGVLVRYRQQLRDDSRDLVVRAPSLFIGRLLNLCGLDDLIESRSARPTWTAGVVSRSSSRSSGRGRLSV